MTRAVVFALLVACSKRDATPVATSGSAAALGSATGSAALGSAGSAAAPALLDGVALPVVSQACNSANLDECRIPNLVTDAQPVVTKLPDCELATAIELRTLAQYTNRCAIVLRHSGAVTIADTLMPCSTWDADRRQAMPRIRVAMATCAAATVNVTLETTDAAHAQTRVQCRHAAGDAITCAREPHLGVGGPAFEKLLADVKRVVEAHQWLALLELCSSDHRKAQIGEMHQDVDTYLAEILGLHSVGNSLSDGRVTSAELDRIERITFVDIVDDGGGWFEVIGIVSLKGHPDLRLEMKVTEVDHRLVLSGALG